MLLRLVYAVVYAKTKSLAIRHDDGAEGRGEEKARGTLLTEL